MTKKIWKGRTATRIGLESIVITEYGATLKSGNRKVFLSKTILSRLSRGIDDARKAQKKRMRKMM